MEVEAPLAPITSLARWQGEVWAGTPGGVLRWDRTGSVTRLTGAQGLPGLRVRHLVATERGLWAQSNGWSRWTGSRWQTASAPPGWREPSGLVARYNGRTVAAHPGGGLRWAGAGGVTRPFLPGVPSPLPGSGVTAIATAGADLLVGTARGQVWRLPARSRVPRASAPSWVPLPAAAPSLRGSDAVALVDAPGGPWIAPREGRSFRRDGHVSTDTVTAPWRTSVRWGTLTAIRRANGSLLFLDDRGTPTVPVIRLPRNEASALASDGETLFVAQFGGTSEFTPSVEPRHRFDMSAILGPTTALAVSKSKLLVGTQNNGLVTLDRHTGQVWHGHETHGLRDDWVTALAPIPGEPDAWLVGTFVGGLHRLDGTRFTPIGDPQACITRLLVDGDRVWVGTLDGVRVVQNGQLATPPWSKVIEPDVTDLLRVGPELWVATGGTLARVQRP